MIRLLVEFLLPLIAPSLLYAIWLGWSRRRQAQAEAEPQDGASPPAPALRGWREAPWLWLALMGVVAMLAVAVTLGFSRSLGDGGTYVAPRVVDGKVVPGHLAPAAR